MPTLIEHQQFIDSDPYEVWYLIKEGVRCLGSVYYTRRGEIGLFLFPEHRGKGYGSVAVSKLRDLCPGPMYANVAPTNERAQKFWLKLGFKPLQITYEL